MAPSAKDIFGATIKMGDIKTSGSYFNPQPSTIASRLGHPQFPAQPVERVAFSDCISQAIIGHTPNGSPMWLRTTVS
jgi:hypothetical protein